MTARVQAQVAPDFAPALPAATLQCSCAFGESGSVSGKCPNCAANERPGVQPKLTINPPGDRWEQEADRIADQVVSDRRPALPGPLPVTPLIQCQTAGEDEIRKKGAGGRMAGPGFAAALSSTGPGRALDPDTRSFMEPRFGRDLSGIRIHGGADAGGLTRQINARAFTRGNHIFIGGDAPDMRSREGRRLLAHEITHTLQQSGNSAAPIQRDGPRANPDIASLPANRYVDAYSEVNYDLDYRAVDGNLSTWLTVTYPDGAQIDINVHDIKDREADVVDSMANGYLGPQGRVFPRELTRNTVPRLWAARQEAISIMEEFNLQFMLAAMPGVIFMITMAGMPPIETAPTTLTRLTRSRPAARVSGQGPGSGSASGKAATRGRAGGLPPAPRQAAAPRQSTGPGQIKATGATAAAASGASGFSFRLLSQRVLRYFDRDIVVVQTSRGAQAFYRRTGKGGISSSGAQPGEWAPFDGVLAGWFDKARYVEGLHDTPLFRFGNQELREASEWLGRQAIRRGDDVGEVFSVVNKFLDELGALQLGG